MKSSDEQHWSALLLPVVLLLAQVCLYVWMAPRGFEFTDESFYLLNYLYWHDLIGTVTFFGAYFALPFQMLGQSVQAMRILSLLLLLSSSGLFTWEAIGYFSRRDGLTRRVPWSFVVTGMAASLFYFDTMSTLRAPSYNLLTLCSMLVATGILLRMLERDIQFTNERLAIFCYGLAIGACILGKVTSGLLLMLFHLLFFGLANRDWRLRHLLEFLILFLAGVSLNFFMLQWAQPNWMEVMREGVTITSLDGSHNLVHMVNSFQREIKAVAPIFIGLALGSGVVIVMAVRWIVPFCRTILSALVVAIVGGCVLGLILGPYNWRLPLLSLAVLLIWSLEGLSREPFHLAIRYDLKDLTLMALLFTLPIAFSFGTGTSIPLLKHSQMAMVFPLVALLLRLMRLIRVGILTFPALVFCLAAISLPTLVIQTRAATDVHYTYRQLSALGKQAMPVHLGAADDTLMVDAATQKTLKSVISTARAAGLMPGKTILDFTGDGPGLIYALGERPLGLAWLCGGYAGSHAIAAHVINRLTMQQLRDTWLLSSENNPRAIKGWQQMLNARLGIDAHELAATLYIQAPYSWGKDAPERISVQLWKPIVLTR